MADDLEQQIRSCKRRIEIVRTLIEEQWANDISTDATERVIAEELNFLKTLQEMLATGESSVDCHLGA